MSLKSAVALFSRKPKQLDLETYLIKLRDRGLTPDGKEITDPVPLAPPIGYKKQPSMVEIVRDMVRGERLKQAAIEAGAETFEESEDFDVGDEPEDLRSPYENEFDPPISELLKAGEASLAEKAAKKATEAKEGVKASGSPNNPAPPPPEPPKPE